MRARGVWALVAVVAIAACAWGALVGREAVPARAADQTLAVDAGWYDALPPDSAQATRAYLERIPSAMRDLGERYSDTRLLAFALRVIALVAATAVILGSGLAAHMRDTALRVASRPVVVDLLVAIQYFVALLALTLPAEVYATFVRPHRFGFSEQSFADWLSDDLVNWASLTLFYLAGVLAIYRLMRWKPRSWIASAVVVYVVLRTLYAVLQPALIEPLTNDFRPLPDGRAKQVILALAQANGVGDAEVVVSDASRQSRIMNAHVSGFGATTRIAVDDTTLHGTSEPMIRFVVAHEIGHFVLDHAYAFVVSDTVVMILGFAFIALGLGVLLRAGGRRWGISGAGDIASLPLFWGLFALWAFLSLPLSNAASRALERQADLFGLNASRAPHGMAEFMIHNADTARLQPHFLEYQLFYDHPSDADRVATAMRWRAAALGSPR